jgi:ribosome maturation factor RimP
MSVIEQIRDLVAPVLADEGLELFDIEFAGGRLVVLADRPGGIDLDALTEATRRISAELDRVDPIPGGRYVLEVSSPGLERRLRTPAHFTSVVGSEISVKTTPTAEGPRRIKGILEQADDDGITVDGQRVAYADVQRAQTVFDWGAGPSPGKVGARPPKNRASKDHEAKEPKDTL